MSVDAQRERRIGVPELGHHVGQRLLVALDERRDRLGVEDLPADLEGAMSC
jgi:hypothetical protein